MNIYYFQVNIMCFIVLVLVFLTMNSRRGILQSNQLTFNLIVLATAIMSFSDIVCWVSSGADFAGAYVLVHLSNMVYFASITFVSYLWLIYVNQKINGPEFTNRKSQALFGIPFFVMLAMILTNPQTHLLYTVSADNVYSRGDGVFIHWIISYGYMLWAVVQTIVGIKKSDTKSRKAELTPLLMFAVWPFVAALAQVLFYGVTATQCGITLSIVTITIQNLQSEVTTDSLTGLNNRAALTRYITERVRISGNHFSVIMCDIDKFKTINDTLGHAVGDLALCSVAGVLREACEAIQPNAFLCRYGGDEFVLCIPGEADDSQKLVGFISEKLQSFDRMPGGIVRLAISAGIASGYCASYDDMVALVEAADEKMYEIKRTKSIVR